MSSREPFLFDASRILILLNQFDEKGKSIESVTKLAKLDFLLRYPKVLNRLLAIRGLRWHKGSQPSWSEIRATEAQDPGYKFGPWDTFYYPILGLLASKRLVSVSRGPRQRIEAKISSDGKDVAVQLSTAWSVETIRASLLARHFNYSGEKLRKQVASAVHLEGQVEDFA